MSFNRKDVETSNLVKQSAGQWSRISSGADFRCKSQRSRLQGI